ncbi:ABC transporter permease [Pseudoalteromonas sp. T1lg23B]|uniref:ABC transporter permease n=1 Tax=Pseudoalteromonas sp. T1lg23B TaxID=2077097 RepID=UPI000CF673A0|nr:ABC transporter permease [Pseudoalteromonas sp. T1lg23B]
MVNYYLKLAWISIRKTPMLSALMVLIIAIGIAITMITFTVSYMMSKHPIPEKADTLQLVYLSSWFSEQPYSEHLGKEEAPHRITYRDAVNLTAANERSDLIKAQTLIADHKALIRTPSQAKSEGKMQYMYATTNDFFDMFNVPFLFGAPWLDSVDGNGEFNVVISKKLNDKLFYGENSVGKQILMDQHTLTISGVLDDWNPTPKYFFYSSSAFEKPLDVYIPIQTKINHELYLSSSFSMYCGVTPENPSFKTILDSECVWIFLWVELNNASDRQAYTNFLHDYDAQQKQLGRFPRDLPSYTRTVEEYLVSEEVVPDNSKIAVWLASAFLIVCLLNCMSLMINKFYNKKGEIGLRRAVGASKQDIAIQFGYETVLIGLLGGLLGLLMAQLGLKAAQSVFHFINDSVMQMNATLVIVTIILAVLSSCLFGLWPIYRAIQVQPSSQLKSL